MLSASLCLSASLVSAALALPNGLVKRDEWCPTVYNEEDGLQLSALREITTGDAWFLATLGAVVHADVDWLQGNIEQPTCVEMESNAGTYKTTLLVKLYNSARNRASQSMVVHRGQAYRAGAPVLVGLTDEDVYDDWDTIWVPVVEQTVKQLREGDADLDIPEDLSGGSPDKALEVIYGKPAECLDVSDDKFDGGMLKRSLALPMVATTGSEVENGWVANHAYSIVGADDSTVDLYNPHGDAVPDNLEGDADGGKFTVKIEGDAGTSYFLGGAIKSICYLSETFE